MGSLPDTAVERSMAAFATGRPTPITLTRNGSNHTCGPRRWPSPPPRRRGRSCRRIWSDATYRNHWPSSLSLSQNAAWTGLYLLEPARTAPGVDLLGHQRALIHGSTPFAVSVIGVDQLLGLLGVAGVPALLAPVLDDLPVPAEGRVRCGVGLRRPPARRA